MTKASVIIIGAGASGIAAGAKLYQNGIEDVIWLEAENRIGGRIYSQEFGDNFIDYGAVGCPGEIGHMVYDIANSHFFDSTGTFVSKEETTHIYKVLFEIVNDDEAIGKFNSSFGEYVTVNFEEKIRTDTVGKDKELCQLILDWYGKKECSLKAIDSLYQISTNEYLQALSSVDLYLNWKEKSCKTVLDLLMKKLPDSSKTVPIEDKIHLHKEVINIKWRKNNEVTVKCADGSVYRADYLIVTLPLGVLKNRHETLFTPVLPIPNVRAIHGLNMGTVNKLIFEYPHRWWPETGFNFLWHKHDIENIKQTFSGSVEDNSWLIDVFGFYPIDYQPNVLLGWVFGESARKMEMLPLYEVKEKLIQLLDVFLGSQFNIPRPVNFVRSTWYTNPHFSGSYSYSSIMTEKLKTSAADLAQPLINDHDRECVFFAGEATDSHYYSTVHGAIESGWREADRIIQLKNSIKRRKSDIIIIGAGIAGLAAAKKLLDENHRDFIILESQNQLGGRIQTHFLNDADFIEIGAQWIHGRNNELWNLANYYNLLTKETSEEGIGIFIRDDGYVFDPDLVAKIDFTVGQILEECEKFFYTNNEKLCPRSVGDYLEERFEEYLSNCIEDTDELKQKKRELFNWHIRFQIIDNACLSLKHLSAKNWGSYFCSVDHTGQAHINIKNGYTSIIKTLTDLLPKNCLQLKTIVSSIEWNRPKSSTVLVTCKNGQIYEANYVICTVSLGVLKKHHKKLFVPELPIKMQETIDKMGFWGINKIFLIFETKWWNVPGFQIIWNEENKCDDFSNDIHWIKCISGFDEVKNNQNILVGWIGGIGAKFVEQIAEDRIGVCCVNLLRKFTGNQDIPYPKNVIRSKWISNPNFYGAYSHPTSDCDTENLGVNQLTKILRNDQDQPILALAGEACHNTQFSTTHGAYESGQIQASIALKNLILK